jgi:hypothetical protein
VQDRHVALLTTPACGILSVDAGDRRAGPAVAPRAHMIIVQRDDLAYALLEVSESNSRLCEPETTYSFEIGDERRAVPMAVYVGDLTKGGAMRMATRNMAQADAHRDSRIYFDGRLPLGLESGPSAEARVDESLWFCPMSGWEQVCAWICVLLRTRMELPTSTLLLSRKSGRSFRRRRE